MWTVTTTTDFDRWCTTDLADDEREEVTAKVNLLKMFGPALKRPQADTLTGSNYPNMKERNCGRRPAGQSCASPSRSTPRGKPSC